MEGAFNAVMLQGDAIREITLEGPGAGGLETASAVVADMVSVIGTTGTGFLQNDACWRELATMPPPGDLRSGFYMRVEVEDSAPGCWPGSPSCSRPRRCSDRPRLAAPRERPRRDRRRHPRGRRGRLDAALDAIGALPEVLGRPDVLRVIPAS